MEKINPTYYKKCSDYGRSILLKSGFPYPECLDDECYKLVNKLGNDFFLITCLKYLWRCGKKNVFGIGKKYFARRDLKKAFWYIEIYLSRVTDTDDWKIKLINNIYNEVYH